MKASLWMEPGIWQPPKPEERLKPEDLTAKVAEVTKQMRDEQKNSTEVVIKEADGRYAPVVGQMDLGGAVVKGKIGGGFARLFGNCSPVACGK